MITEKKFGTAFSMTYLCEVAVQQRPLGEYDVRGDCVVGTVLEWLPGAAVHRTHLERPRTHQVGRNGSCQAIKSFRSSLFLKQQKPL